MSMIMARLPTLDDLDVEGRRVLLRTDLDVPLFSGPAGAAPTVADDTRIRAALPTIEELLRRGARVVLVSHLGRPNGADQALSMRPVADRLATLTGATVPLAPGVTGAEVRELTMRLAPGAMLMLENVRFAVGETRNDPRLASALAELADLYVADAFASTRRAHASTEGVAHLLPAAAGRLMEREMLALSAIVERPARPLVAILGGARLRGKLGVVGRFLGLADAVCVGGGMCIPFLAALGHRVGRALCPPEALERARLALNGGGELARLEIPSDLRLERWGEETGIVPRPSGALGVPYDQMLLDIGPDTAERYVEKIDEAATVFWSGPMGRFELPSFAGGSQAIAEAVAWTSATTVIGGSATVQALRTYGLQDRVSHLSTGGGATLEFLEGRELPGVEVLRGEGVSAR
jgi:phosphoglycerate kinase